MAKQDSKPGLPEFLGPHPFLDATVVPGSLALFQSQDHLLPSAECSRETEAQNPISAKCPSSSKSHDWDSGVWGLQGSEEQKGILPEEEFQRSDIDKAKAKRQMMDLGASPPW